MTDAPGSDDEQPSTPNPAESWWPASPEPEAPPEPVAPTHAPGPQQGAPAPVAPEQQPTWQPPTQPPQPQQPVYPPQGSPPQGPPAGPGQYWPQDAYSPQAQAQPRAPWGPPTPFPSQYGRKNEPMAIAALVTGLIALVFGVLCYVGVGLGPLAAGFGITATRRIANSSGRLTGRGMAIAGIVTGAIAFVAAVAWLAFIVTHPDTIQQWVDQLTTTTTTGG